jgi:hypothetical protein
MVDTYESVMLHKLGQGRHSKDGAQYSARTEPVKQSKGWVLILSAGCFWRVLPGMRSLLQGSQAVNPAWTDSRIRVREKSPASPDARPHSAGSSGFPIEPTWAGSGLTRYPRHLQHKIRMLQARINRAQTLQPRLQPPSLPQHHSPATSLQSKNFNLS